MVVLEVEVLESLAGGKAGAEAFCAGRAECVALEVEAFQTGAAFQELGEDLHADVGEFVEGEVDVPQQLPHSRRTCSRPSSADDSRITSRSQKRFEKFSLSFPRKMRSR